MKKLKVILLFCIITVMILIFSGCASNRIDDDKAAEDLANQIFECLNNKDAEGLKSLFSKNVLESYDLDEEIEALFEIFDGKIVSYNDFGADFSREEVDMGRQTLLAIETWISNVETDAGKIYVIRFSAFIVNEDDKDRVGIDGLKIIVDDETEYVVGDW